jgi:hypothetical protein
MQPAAAIELQDTITGDSQARPLVVILSVSIRDNGIETVVAAFELNEDEELLVLAGWRCTGETGTPCRDSSGTEHSNEIASFHERFR